MIRVSIFDYSAESLKADNVVHEIADDCKSLGFEPNQLSAWEELRPEVDSAVLVIVENVATFRTLLTSGDSRISLALKNRACAFVMNRDCKDQATLAEIAGVIWISEAYLFPDTMAVCDGCPSRSDRLAWLARYGAFTASLKAMRNSQIWRNQRDLGEPLYLNAQVMHLNIFAKNLSRSLQFYESALGVRYCYNLGPSKIVTEFAGFDFFIEQADDFHYPPGFHFGVRTTSTQIERFAQRIQDLGVPFVKGNGPEPGLHFGPDLTRRAFYFCDPDGLLIEVYSPEIAMLATNPALVDEQIGNS